MKNFAKPYRLRSLYLFSMWVFREFELVSLISRGILTPNHLSCCDESAIYENIH